MNLDIQIIPKDCKLTLKPLTERGQAWLCEHYPTIVNRQSLYELEIRLYMAGLIYEYKI